MATKNRARGELIVLDGGPKDRYWYWLSDWQLHVQAVRDQNFEADHPANSALHYQATTRALAHTDPELGHGQIWTYTPPAAPRITRVLVTGSRTWTDTTAIRDALAEVWSPDTVLVHGGCPRGADQFADACWTRWGGQVERHPANWDRDGKTAGFVRNRAMVEAGADLCLAFIHNSSRGATHCATTAQEAGITTRIHRAD